MYVSKEGYTRFFFLFGDEKERSVLRVAMLLCSEKKNEIDFGQLHLIPHPLLLSRSLARALSLCLSVSLSLSLAAAAGVYLYAIKGKHYFARIILTTWSLATFATPPNQ